MVRWPRFVCRMYPKHYIASNAFASKEFAAHAIYGNIKPILN